MLAISPGDAQKAGGETTFKVNNLGGQDRKILQDGADTAKWESVGDGEILVTTTVGHHTFVIR